MRTAEWSLVLTPLRAIYARFWATERWLVIGTTLVVLASAVCSVLTPFVFSRLIDGLGITDIPTAVLWAFAGYAALRGLTTALDYCVNYLSIIATENLNFVTSMAFFEQLLRKPISFFIEHNAVEVQTARNKGEDAVYIVMQLIIIVFVPGVTLIGLSIAMLGAVINLELALIVCCYGAAFIGLTYWANAWTRPLLDKAIDANQDNSRFVGNAMTAMETLRYFNGDRWISRRFEEKANLSRASWVAWSQRRVALSVVFGSALAVQLAISFLLLLPRYAAGELSVGDIVLINMMLVELNRPFEMIGSAIDDVMRSHSNFLPFARMWAEPNDRGALGRDPLVLEKGELAFHDVSFSYGPKRVIEGLSFVAGRGHITFLSGETGAGKSTAFKLALKALEPSSGRITVDGADLGGISRESWYEHVGVVPQDVVLLADSLGSNIVLGRDFDADRLREVCRKAHILPFIERLPDGFETTVGERGLKLSGGERQRVAIARALYGAPKMLLLDEASSALDEVTEASIIAELRELNEEVTIVAITHRKSVIAPTDQVIQFTGGSGARDNVESSDENAAVGQDGL